MEFFNHSRELTVNWFPYCVRVGVQGTRQVLPSFSIPLITATCSDSRNNQVLYSAARREVGVVHAKKRGCGRLLKEEQRTDWNIVEGKERAVE